MTTSLTSGGRALNAIWDNQDLSQSEKMFLLYLSSRADFNSDFREPRFESVARICAATGMSRAHVLATAKSLEAGVSKHGLPVEHGGGYISRTQRRQDGVNLPSFYTLTSKLFDQYAVALDRRASEGGGSPQRGRVVSEADGGSPQRGLGVVRSADPSSLRVSSFKSSLTILGGAKAPRKTLKKDSTLTEAITIGHLLFIPVDRGQGRRRFVDLVALDAMLEEQLARHGIEVFRHFRTISERNGELGSWIFDPNRVAGMFDRVSADLKNHREEQAVQ